MVMATRLRKNGAFVKRLWMKPLQGHSRRATHHHRLPNPDDHGESSGVDPADAFARGHQLKEEHGACAADRQVAAQFVTVGRSVARRSLDGAQALTNCLEVPNDDTRHNRTLASPLAVGLRYERMSPVSSYSARAPGDLS